MMPSSRPLRRLGRSNVGALGVVAFLFHVSDLSYVAWRPKSYWEGMPDVDRQGIEMMQRGHSRSRGDV
jgi:hypothetical protein